ncbi:hypothetical protein ACSU64_08615 [Bacillaceae bacterium C204]|uniref:hypothetical protein n=1 Tax=Neobacillus sp. 204 TaxID=3383351 RepID=UPI00397A91A3
MFEFEKEAEGEFRKKASNELSKGKYKKVIQLCLDGEQADTEYRGLVHKWREYRYQAYELLGDTEQQKSTSAGQRL